MVRVFATLARYAFTWKDRSKNEILFEFEVHVWVDKILFFYLENGKSISKQIYNPSFC